jgi:hypothetical protein
MCVVAHWRYTTNRFSWFAPRFRSLEWNAVSALEYYTAHIGQETAMTLNIATSFPVAAETQTAERPFKEYLSRLSEATDVRRGIPLPLGTGRRQLRPVQPRCHPSPARALRAGS